MGETKKRDKIKRTREKKRSKNRKIDSKMFMKVGNG